MRPIPDMDELVLRVLQGRAAEDERVRIKAWLDAFPENRTRFEELREVWRLAEQGFPSIRSDPRPQARDLLIRREGAAAAVPSTSMRHRWGRRRRLWVAPLAAAGMAAVAVGLHLLTEAQQPQFSFGVEEFSTGPSETVTVRLEDGTIVRLGSSSGLRIDGQKGGRDVWLDGQAFFAVAHLDEIPFTVRTQAGTTTVLGTRFDVRARDDDLRLVVVDGRVRVEAGSTERPAREVGPSEMGHVIGGGQVYVTQVEDVHELLEWMDGALIFQSTSLERAAEELQHRYGLPVKVVDQGVASRTVTAWFTDQPVEHAVTVICRAADVICEVSETGVRIGL